MKGDFEEQTRVLYKEKEGINRIDHTRVFIMVGKDITIIMPTNLKVNDYFPDIELPNQMNKPVRLSHYTKAGLLDEHLGFTDGYPLILVFLRGFFCPRDQQQMRMLVKFQPELNVNYGRLVTVSADPPLVQAAFRAGLTA